MQPLAKELVEVYGYNKDEIKNYSQFRISLSPSDEKKSYPVDIAVFEKGRLKIICKCKKISSQEGKEQVNKLLFYSTFPHLSNRIKEIGLIFPKDIRESCLKTAK